MSAAVRFVKAKHFRQMVEAESTSGSNLSVNAVDKLKAKASSGGTIRYKGNPELLVSAKCPAEV
jgi:hypothetical protein